MTAGKSEAAATREHLLEMAGRVLAEQGPHAFSTRTIADQSNVSKMGVYTHFGSLGGLAHALVAEGFYRLGERIASVQRTGDVRTDIAAISLAFVENARANANLYRVMFGSASLGQFGPVTSEEMQSGRRGTLDEVVALIQQATDAGEFAPGSAWRRANQWFSAVHGYTMLELSGFIRSSDGPAKVLLPLLGGVFAGFETPEDVDEAGRARSHD